MAIRNGNCRGGVHLTAGAVVAVPPARKRIPRAGRNWQRSVEFIKRHRRGFRINLATFRIKTYGKTVHPPAPSNGRHTLGKDDFICGVCVSRGWNRAGTRPARARIGRAAIADDGIHRTGDRRLPAIDRMRSFGGARIAPPARINRQRVVARIERDRGQRCRTHSRRYRRQNPNQNK